MTQKIVVGLSGGVDSSVTAHLLQQQGYDVVGVFMQNWEDDNNDEYCSIKEDSMDAIAVADLLGIDIELVNFAGQYKDRVFSYFLAEYSAGRTPNPDILCNSEIKFKCFLDYAIELGGAKMATGHYAANRVRPDGRTELIRAADQSKDQTYFFVSLKPGTSQPGGVSAGRIAEIASARHRRRNWSAQRQKERQHRHLFYWRTTLPRFSESLSTQSAGGDGDARRPGHGRAYG